ncbi:MAG: hypothetical protein WC634_02870, partial [archaeon]
MKKAVLIMGLLFTVALSGCVNQEVSGPTFEENTGFVPSNVTPQTQNEEPDFKYCPYECCLSGEYITKICQSKFKCENNSCISLCHEVTYFENIPKQVTVPYTERVCVDVPYKEAYQEQECHKEELIYLNSALGKSSYWNITEGCVIKAAIDVTNKDTNLGLFGVEFKFATNAGTIVRETVEHQIGSSSLKIFEAKYDKSCFEPDPEISFEVLVPLKEVCVMVTKYQDKTRQECHDEARQRIETVYEKVEKTKTVCEDEPDICVTLNCDDNEECTVDSCNESGCHNNPKSNGGTCTGGICQNGTCIKQIAQATCNHENCTSKSNTKCSGTTKVTTTYYCEGDVCKSSESQETNNVECGYSEQPAPVIKSNSEKIQDIIANFSELNGLSEGASISLYIFDTGEKFVIYKEGGAIKVKKSGSGDIEITLGQIVFDYLAKSSNVCASIKSLKNEGALSESDIIVNIGFPD